MKVSNLTVCCVCEPHIQNMYWYLETQQSLPGNINNTSASHVAVSKKTTHSHPGSFVPSLAIPCGYFAVRHTAMCIL